MATVTGQGCQGSLHDGHFGQGRVVATVTEDTGNGYSYCNRGQEEGQVRGLCSWRQTERLRTKLFQELGTKRKK